MMSGFFGFAVPFVFCFFACLLLQTFARPACSDPEIVNKDA